MHRLSLGGRSLLYSESRQKLYELNETADLIWRGLIGGQSAAAAAHRLCGLGVPAEAADAFVRDAIRAWSLEGHILPASAASRLAGAPAAVRTVVLDELHVALAFHGGASPQACDAVFGHLWGDAATRPQRLTALGHGELVFLLREARALGACAPDDLPALVKAALTEAYVAAAGEGFVAHGAFLTRGRAALMLAGEPGAGKTTLALALAASGWAYGGDDIVRFDGGGLARGVPFAGALKPGAWDLAERFAPGVADLPTAVRGDGQSVRYWRPAKLAPREPRPLTAFVVLARAPGAAARLEPIDAVEALQTLLSGAYAESRRLPGETLAALATRLDGACCARLIYEDLTQAAALLERLADA